MGGWISMHAVVYVAGLLLLNLLNFWYAPVPSGTPGTRRPSNLGRVGFGLLTGFVGLAAALLEGWLFDRSLGLLGREWPGHGNAADWAWIVTLALAPTTIGLAAFLVLEEREGPLDRPILGGLAAIATPVVLAGATLVGGFSNAALMRALVDVAREQTGFALAVWASVAGLASTLAARRLGLRDGRRFGRVLPPMTLASALRRVD